MPGTGGPRVIQGVGFWAQQPIVLVAGPIGARIWELVPAHLQPRPIDQFWGYAASLNTILRQPDTTKLFRGPLKSLPDQPAPPNAFQSWTWSYNRNLIGQDKLPAGDQLTDLAPGQRPYEQTRLLTWQWSLNLPLYYQSTSRNLNLPGVIADDLPLAYSLAYRIDQTWVSSYNRNLIGKDQLPVGEQLYDRPTLPVPLIFSYTFQFQALLSAALPFNQYSWPVPMAAPQPVIWSQPYNVALYFVPPVADTTKIFRGIWRSLPDQPAIPLVQQSPFPNIALLHPTVVTFIQRQQDWPLPQAPRQPAQSWTSSYNLNLIGQDKLPVGEIVTDRPTLPIPPAQTWLDLPKYNLIAKPFLQSDWPNPTQPYRIEQTWTRSYNLNLIGQDRMVTGEQVTDLPPRDFARLFQTWISSVNLALTTAPPNIFAQARQQDWPIPRGAEPDWRRSWEWSYNLNLIGQDKLPNRQQDWPNPTAPYRAPELSSWIDRTKLLLLVPFRQTDWPNPRAPQQAALGFTASYNLNLIGQDQLPVGKPVSDLPPREALRASDLRTWIQSVNLALTTVAARLPFNQSDWPLPRGAQQPAQSFTGSYNLNLIGKDRFPIRITDWPNPNRGPQQPDRSFGFVFNRNLIGKDKLPFRQSDWPNPNPGPMQPDRSFMFGMNSLFIPPPPPPPPSIGIGNLIGAYPRWRKL